MGMCYVSDNTSDVIIWLCRICFYPKQVKNGTLPTVLPPPASCSRRFPVSMTQPMQNLQLTQSRKVPGGPASPSAAKRLYRNLSEKLRGSTSSFEDTYFFGKSDRLRKASVSEWGGAADPSKIFGVGHCFWNPFFVIFDRP